MLAAVILVVVAIVLLGAAWPYLLGAALLIDAVLRMLGIGAD